MNAYLIRNKVNDKVYVGITTNYQQRWAWHRSAVGRNVPLPLYNAFRKYGLDSFTFEIIAAARSWDDLCAIEAVLIRQYNSYGATGYNATRGGDGTLGRVHSAEERAARSAKMQGNKNGTKTHDALRGKSFVRGIHSPEAIAKQSAARVGLKQSAETIAKRIATFSSPEYKAKMSTPARLAARRAVMATAEYKAAHAAGVVKRVGRAKALGKPYGNAHIKRKASGQQGSLSL